MTLSTHVLDTGLGEPASGVPVRLERAHDGGWLAVSAGTTDDDGRLRDWVPDDQWHAGTYRLVFDVGAYFRSRKLDTFLGSVTLEVRLVGGHQHIPLLVSRYGIVSYLGS